MSRTQRLSFATFLAKLASTRVSKDRICQIALVLFRSTFEERRELRHSQELEPDEEQNGRRIDHLDIASLLPAACAWFKEAGYNLIQLSEVFWNDCPGTIGQGGQWFIESELGKRSPIGFTPWRWMYWLRRLQEIRDKAKGINEKRIEQYATDAIGLMVNQANERNSGILRAYRDGGATLHQEKQLLCLKKGYEMPREEDPAVTYVQQGEEGRVRCRKSVMHGSQ